jgi:hypothetical protein
MSSIFEIQPIGRFIGQSAAIKRPKVCIARSNFGLTLNSSIYFCREQLLHTLLPRLASLESLKANSYPLLCFGASVLKHLQHSSYIN